MGFKSLLEGQVQGVMAILGQVDGLAPEITYVETGSRTYDTATRTYSSVDTNHPNVPAVLAKFKVDEMDDEVVSKTDFKCIIAALDLPVAPKSQDQIVVPAGLSTAGTYNVERLMGVPGDSLYILHVRKV